MVQVELPVFLLLLLNSSIGSEPEVIIDCVSLRLPTPYSWCSPENLKNSKLFVPSNEQSTGANAL